MVSDDDLIGRLESLQQSIDGLREDTRKKVRTNRRAIIAAVVIGMLGVAFGGIGIKHGIDADNSRKQRTVAACQQANDAVQKQADADKDHFDAFIDLLVSYSGGRVPPKTVQAAKKKQHASIQNVAETATDKGGLHRDCSPAGLAKYYAPKH